MVTMTANRPAPAVTISNRPAPLNHGDLQDEELMERLSYREIAALERLYDRYGNLVYSTALRVVRDVHFAEDISQEVFVRLWRTPERYVAQRGRFLNWLLSVTRNRAVDGLRSRRRRHRYETISPEQRERELPAGDAQDPALAAELADQRRTVRAALAGLPPDQRQAIELAYFNGLSQREVAHLLGQPLGTVKTRIRLGMQKLRVAFQPTHGSQDGVLGLSA
ncbi:MAG: sigma-70 family RNA polymerase sigma factor [Dehalococcoidia bacterium]